MKEPMPALKPSRLSFFTRGGPAADRPREPQVRAWIPRRLYSERRMQRPRCRRWPYVPFRLCRNSGPDFDCPRPSENFVLGTEYIGLNYGYVHSHKWRSALFVPLGSGHA